MKKISYYVIAVIGVGILISSFWVYQKYFKSKSAEFFEFKVERGDIQEIIKARGEVAAIKDVDLEFPFPGTIEKFLLKKAAKSPKTAL
ncbi:hypothetical protein HZB04_01160 [Candidatus Wolfebacteria bacterium]|nr:hypothetical protein [Candidatus Wolfebacteria bacterium]